MCVGIPWEFRPYQGISWAAAVDASYNRAALLAPSAGPLLEAPAAASSGLKLVSTISGVPYARGSEADAQPIVKGNPPSRGLRTQVADLQPGPSPPYPRCSPLRSSRLAKPLFLRMLRTAAESKVVVRHHPISGMYDFIVHRKHKDVVEESAQGSFQIRLRLAVHMTEFRKFRCIRLGFERRRSMIPTPDLLSVATALRKKWSSWAGSMCS